jgi:uncharacterized repeat protein (TIGR03803 family)
MTNGTLAMRAVCAMFLPLAANAASLTTVYQVPGRNDGAAPIAALLHLNGKLYGTASEGGPANAGTIFSVDPHTGAETTLYAFTGGADGGQPSGPLTAIDGIVYGTTFGGGAGVGTLYKFDPGTRTETVLYTFPTAGENGNPRGGLLFYGGMLYGTSQFGGDSANGYVFRIDPATGAETTIYSFKNSFGGGDDGAYPVTAPILYGNMLYGTTVSGGSAARGTIYQLNPATGAETSLHSFGVKNDGQSPDAPLLLLNGKLYGTASGGGKSGHGTVFVYDPASGTEATLHDFNGPQDGYFPNAGLLSYGGLLYGTADAGGAYGLGTVFSIDPGNGNLKTVHAFADAEGGAPVAELIERDGSLYGTGQAGGAAEDGAVFAIDLADSGREVTLHAFSGTESSSEAALILQGGTLYGASTGGGDGGLGSIFKVDLRSGKGVTLYSFAGDTDGQYPYGALLGVGGTLYGTTRNGGPFGQGTVFAFNPATRAKTTIYAFTGADDGGLPRGGLIGLGGLLYGTAYGGGSANDGIAFSIDPSTGTETTLHAFTGGADGSLPFSGMIYTNGKLFGTTLSGGSAKAGTVFQIDPSSGVESTLYAFKGGADGSDPVGGLLYSGGMLYGATAGFGGKQPHGTIYQLDPANGAETVLHSFDAYSGPEGALVKLGASLYGTIPDTDIAGFGSVFKINPVTGKTQTVYSFSGGADGGLPTAPLLNVGGVLYGTTNSISSANAGTVFRLDR